MPHVSLANLTDNAFKGAGRTGSVLESWQKGTLATLPYFGLICRRVWGGGETKQNKTKSNLLEVLIILFVNNHLLLSDQEPA